MAGDNFQDNIKLDSLTRLVAEGPAVVIGTDPGAKSVILKNDVGEMHLAGNPGAGTVTIQLPAAGGTLIASGQAVQGLGVSTGGNTAGSTGTTQGTVVLAGAGVITLSQSTAAGSLATITISAPAQSLQPAVGGVGISTGGNTAGTSGTKSGTIVLAGINGITLSQATDANGNTISISGNNGGNIAAIGVSTGGGTAGTTGTTIGTMVLAGGNGITLSQSTAGGSLATITISAMDVVEGIGVSTGGNTAGNTGTTLGTLVFAGAGIITLSQSTAAGSLATISISAKNPENRSFSFPNQLAGSFGISDAGMSFVPFSLQAAMTATKMMVIAHLTGASASTGAMTISVGVYTLSGSTASLASSDSRNLSWTSGTTVSVSSAYGGVSGTQYRTVALNNWSMPPGDYLLGIWFKTTNNGSWTFFGNSQTFSIANAPDANQTNVFLPGFSTSSFTTAFPASINVTNTNYVRTGISAMRMVGYMFQGSG